MYIMESMKYLFEYGSNSVKAHLYFMTAYIFASLGYAF
jgi:hypothetical protein